MCLGHRAKFKFALVVYLSIISLGVINALSYQTFPQGVDGGVSSQNGLEMVLKKNTWENINFHYRYLKTLH